MWDDETILLIDRLNKELKETKSELNKLSQQIRRDIDFYNQVIQGLRSGELPWDRVQIMETGQLKILEEAPSGYIVPEEFIDQPIPCNEGMAASMEKLKNGKDKVKADVT